MGSASTLAEVYRRFAEDDGGASPLNGRVAVAVSQSSAALRALDAAPARKRRPALVLAALHDLALAGRAPALAEAYAAGDGDAAATAAVDTLTALADAVVAIVTSRQLRAEETGRATVLYPAIAYAAHRVGASAIGLIDVSCSAGLNLTVDRVGLTYGNGQTLGDVDSAVQQSAAVVGDRRLPDLGLPEVVARVGIDRDPLDVTDPDDLRWLRACVAPDQREQLARLDAEVALAASEPPVLLTGTAAAMLPDAVTRVPAHAAPVITSTWALSRLPLEGRRHFLDTLDEAAAGRPVAWVSVEGVGVAPTIPTLGDRPASGHSIIGLATFDRAGRHSEALGRCWSRGRLLSWLAED
ncbi:DUF2332 domain-containing protein [Occultella gossypii]|uniref:DUF2332 domain-containing protein n=1 Tax=Occultella gossypii TaxID=2800820 RepID=A0ABS7SI35_9MICO|nr:DUF2332 domain-containing protein [Occultella gossypii]MBZ2198971.1 DUF2332 domain-containing protein [Occultella gossypii]